MCAPAAPAVEIAQQPAVSESDMARVVPSWAARLAAEDDGAPYISAARFIARGYSPYQRDKTYSAIAKYVKRIERTMERRGSAMLSVTELLPGEGELPGKRDGHNLMVSKRYFIRSVLGYLPQIPGVQP